MHPDDAATRGLAPGDVVLVTSEHGACVAGLLVDHAVLPGCVQMSTGAWYQPEDLDGRITCVHGNPNAVTADIPTSGLSQGCAGQLSRVRVARHDGPVPEVSVTRQPPNGACAEPRPVSS